ncbi:hypothetical protein [Bacteroides clarus]|uniref:hypothetical protein n=1 Tax=Bacteroides clarus TaxID=626929 RepID=UPI00266C3798|nr:hypothetical protein [Bacteroides clarus]
MKKILYIGTIDTYNYYKEGKNPSHWLYGAVEMEKDGHKVIWEQESSDLWNDYKLIKQHQPDIIFIPNLNLHNHKLLLLLSALGIYRKPVFAWLHHEPQRKKGIKAIIYSILLSGCKHLFFLSEKTMAVIVTHGLVKKEKCSILQWGADSIFYNNIKTKNTGYFVSTGKEQRDFNILIEAFKKTGAPLKIITCKSHAGNNFENLPDRCNGITNIEVIITENSGEIYPQMVQAMANAQALVCPLRQDKLNYCVGLSTIVDAEGLRKPLIITHNPYHSEERMHSFHVVKTLEEWIEAIHSIQISKKEIPITCYNMQKCYKAMKVIMKL